MHELFTMILFFLLIWIILAIFLKWFGRVKSIPDGMKKIGKSVCDWWCDSETPSYPIAESEVEKLTQHLSKFFSYLFFDHGVRSGDSITIVYRCGVCNVNLTVIDAIFQKFLIYSFSYPPNVNLVTDSYICNGCLVLIYAFTPDAITCLHQQRINRLLQQVPHDDDIEE